MASEVKKMIAGDYYRPADPESRVLAKVSLGRNKRPFNQEVDRGEAIIKEWFDLNPVKTSILIARFL